MSHNSVEKLVKMANQIGDFFGAQKIGAAAGMAEHLRKFWAPAYARNDHRACKTWRRRPRADRHRGDQAPRRGEEGRRLNLSGLIL